MKNTLLTVALAAIFAVGGCSDKGAPGGPGAKDKKTEKDKKDNKPIIGSGDDTFTLSVPNLTIKQGEAKTEKIKITRGKNFEQDVEIKFDKLPEGVTADPAAPKIEKSKTEIEVKFTAKDDAALGKFDVKVIGHPATGPDSSNDIKVTVEKK